MIDSVLKTNPWIYKTKNFNVEKIIGSFYEKGLLLSKLQISYYLETDSHDNGDVKVVVSLSNHAADKELNNAAGVDTSSLVAKSDFIDY